MKVVNSRGRQRWWLARSMNEVPVFRVDRQGRALLSDVQAVNALDQSLGRVRLENHRQLLGQVVLPLPHKAHVRIGEGLLDEMVVDGVAVLACVTQRTRQEELVPGRQVVGHVTPAKSPVGKLPRAAGRRATDTVLDHSDYAIEGLR